MDENLQSNRIHSARKYARLTATMSYSISTPVSRFRFRSQSTHFSKITIASTLFYFFHSLFSFSSKTFLMSSLLKIAVLPLAALTE